MKKNISAYVGILAFVGIIDFALIWLAENFLVMDLSTRRYVYFQITIVFSLAVIILWRNKSWYKDTNTASSILTFIGVLGTFYGIYDGLQTFNPTELQDSIAVLLNSLKLAFGTSIVGIVTSILLKAIISPVMQRIQKRSSEDAEQKAIYKPLADALKEALESTKTDQEHPFAKRLEEWTGAIKRENETIKGTLKNLIKNLTDVQDDVSEKLKALTETVEEKNDLIVNAQKNEAIETRKTLTDMQSELTDRQNKAFIQFRTLTKTFSYEHSQLRKEFETFSQNVAESITELATKELIASLTNVIENFNSVISEQFGDNFKQLNEAVEKTVAWQEQYRQQMGELADEFRIAAESIEKSRESVALIAESSNTIADRSESIVACTEKLDPILHTLNDQLDAFSSLRQRAHEAFPLIESRLDELTTDFSSAVQTAIRESHDNVEAQRDALLEQSVLLETTVKSTTENIDQLATNFTKSVNTSIEQSHDSMNQQREALTQRFSELESATAAASQQLQASIDGIGSEFDDVFEESRNHIAQLMAGFAKDITQQLKSTLDEITTDFSDTVKTTIADSHKSMDSQREALISHSNTLQTTMDNIAQRVDNITQEVSSTVGISKTAMNQQGQELSDLTRQLQSNCQILEKTLEAVLTESLQSLARTHGESLRNLGINLASISKKFADDYIPLTEELQRLVDIASDTQSNRGRDIPF